MNDFNIDRRSKIPYDKQLQLVLRSMISRGVLRKGAALQDIQDLALELDIDQKQVLSAYQRLEKERRVIHQNGIWIVSTASIPKTFFDEFVPIYESIRRNTRSVPSIKTLQLDPKHKVKGDIAKWLSSSTAIYTKRVYYGDDTPYILANVYISESILPGFESELVKNEPYFTTLRDQHQLILSASERQMNGVNLKKEDAMILGVPEGTACYHTIVLNYNQDGLIYEVVETFGIPEIMHFTLEQDE